METSNNRIDGGPGIVNSAGSVTETLKALVAQNVSRNKEVLDREFHDSIMYAIRAGQYLIIMPRAAGSVLSILQLIAISAILCIKTSFSRSRRESDTSNLSYTAFLPKHETRSRTQQSFKPNV